MESTNQAGGCVTRKPAGDGQTVIPEGNTYGDNGTKGMNLRAIKRQIKQQKLIDNLKAAHFFHTSRHGGLTYQSCRFCSTSAHENYDEKHSKKEKCWHEVSSTEPCHGLWKYGVRHYACTACRNNILNGLPPNPKPRRSER